MISNLVTSQVIRLVTEKVVENLSRQAGQAIGPGASAPPGSLTDMAVLAQVNNRIGAVSDRFDAVDERLERLDRRLGAVETKTGWRHTLRLTLGILVGIAVGFGAAALAHALHLIW